MSPTTFLSREQPIQGERRVLEVLELSEEAQGLKLADVAKAAGVSVRVAQDYLRVLRGKGKVERLRGKGHEVFYRRRRR